MMLHFGQTIVPFGKAREVIEITNALKICRPGYPIAVCHRVFKSSNVIRFMAYCKAAWMAIADAASEFADALNCNCGFDMLTMR